MSRSVSAPSSVTNTSPCWNGLIVPGSTLRYGSNFCTCTFSPRALSRRPSEAAVIPLPSEETTPPVTKTYLVPRVSVTDPRDPSVARSYGRELAGRLRSVNRHAIDRGDPPVVVVEDEIGDAGLVDPGGLLD